MSGLTHGTLLGGRVVHTQPATGHRTGLEPVLLAASIPTRPGERVLEGGTGSGAGLLCLAARVPGAAGVGVERDAATADLARANIAANGFAGLDIVTADLLAGPLSGLFDHTFANPPWHDAHGSRSPDAHKESSKRAAPGLLAAWVAALAAPLRWRGTLTLVIAAGVVPEVLAACAAQGCGSLALLPLWPRQPGPAAKLLLIRAIKGGRGPFRLLPGLVLHGSGSTYTAACQAVLKGGAALEFDAPAARHG